MAITFVNAGTASSTNGSAPTPGLPASLQVNDLMVAAFYSKGITDETVSISSGWTQIVNDRTSGGLLGLWYRKYQSGDAAPTFTLTNHATGASGETAIAQIAAWRGVDTTTPLDATGTVSTNGAQANIGAISGITLGARDVVIVVGGKLDDWTSVATLTGDSLTWAEIGEPNTTSGSDAGMVWDYAIDGGSGTTVTSKTFTVTGGTSVAGKGVMFSLNVNIYYDGTATSSPTSSTTSSGERIQTGDATSAPVSSVTAAGEVVAGGLAPGDYGYSNYGSNVYGSFINYVDAQASATATTTTTTSGQRLALGTGTATTTSSTTASGQRLGIGSASDTATSATSASAEKVFLGSATATAASSVTASGERLALGTGSLSATSATTSSGERLALGAATATALSSVSSSALRVALGSATDTVTSAVTATGERLALGSSTVSPSSTTSASGLVVKLADGTAGASSSVSADGQRLALSGATATANSSVSVDYLRIVSGAPDSIAANSAVIANGGFLAYGDPQTIAATTAGSASGVLLVSSGASANAQSDVIIAVERVRTTRADAQSNSAITANGTIRGVLIPFPAANTSAVSASGRLLWEPETAPSSSWSDANVLSGTWSNATEPLAAWSDVQAGPDIWSDVSEESTTWQEAA